MNSLKNTIWIFHGAQGRFASGVFTRFEKAEFWIKKHSLTGVLTEYPIAKGVYDWPSKMNFLPLKMIGKESLHSSKVLQRPVKNTFIMKMER